MPPQNLLLDTFLEVRLDHINRQTRTQLVDRNKRAISEAIKRRRINKPLASQHAGCQIVGAGAGHGPGLRCAAYTGHSAVFHTGNVDVEHIFEFHAIHWSFIGTPEWGGACEGDEDADCGQILHFGWSVVFFGGVVTLFGIVRGDGVEVMLTRSVPGLVDWCFGLDVMN